MEKTKCLIIGAGPAGLSAAIYTARAGVPTLVIGCAPKVAGDYDIDNYFGFPETISGADLMDRGLRQAQRFGAEVRCDQILGLHTSEAGGFVAKTVSGEIEARSVIIAAGVSRNRPNIPGLDRYDGKGVSWCVSCDGFFYRGRKVLVVGERDYAANQAIELLAFTPQVSVCTGGKPSQISPDYAARLAEHGIAVTTAKITALSGDPALTAVTLDPGGEQAMDGIFVAMGQASALDFAATLGLVRHRDFIEADEDQKTNIPGVFAAGDCVGKFLQIGVAVGEGAKAARSAIRFLKERKEGGTLGGPSRTG